MKSKGSVEVKIQGLKLRLAVAETQAEERMRHAEQAYENSRLLLERFQAAVEGAASAQVELEMAKAMSDGFRARAEKAETALNATTAR